MGKVKRARIRNRRSSWRLVSIPYGKGKVKISPRFLFLRNLYQFPMGKVKPIVHYSSSYHAKYQFPMGKVKCNCSQCIIPHSRQVSIPYGKGKADSALLFILSRKVSIPYGKGKGTGLSRASVQLILYQFPMGKVKKAKSLLKDGIVERYQFPMGKVKNNILCCVFIIIHRYRFVK